MFGLVVMEGMTLSGYLSNIDEICPFQVFQKDKLVKTLLQMPRQIAGLNLMLHYQTVNC